MAVDIMQKLWVQAWIRNRLGGQCPICCGSSFSYDTLLELQILPAAPRIRALNLLYFVGPSEGFREEIGVQSGRLAFAGDAVLAWMSLEQA